MNQPDYAESITIYIEELKKGSENAANTLVARYWPRVVAAASAQLNSTGIRLKDEEDIAVSVFDYLCRQASQGKFSDEKMNDRTDLWLYLSTLIKHKAIDVARKEKAAKRGSGKVVNESALESEERPTGLGNFEGIAKTPVEQAIQIEEKTQFLASLSNDEIREIVVLYLEGYQQSEIAEKIGLSERTIRRKLELAKETLASLAEK